VILATFLDYPFRRIIVFISTDLAIAIVVIIVMSVIIFFVIHAGRANAFIPVITCEVIVTNETSGGARTAISEQAYRSRSQFTIPEVTIFINI
jgi:hypothetical protein